MRFRKHMEALICASALIISLPLVIGCGPGGSGPQTANVQAGDMPAGGEWTGVYFNPLYGSLHLVQDGNAISGKWLRPNQDRWGELHGTVTGDLMKFEWKEYVIGLVGPNSQKSGKGYFKYTRPGENVDDQIAGEIGRDGNEVGEPWDGVKQRNVKPDLDSIGGSGAGDVGGGDWDSDNKEKGQKPEEPQPPPAPGQ